ncbi:hypothetical protein [Legionella sp. PC997]|uniref:hypothetical protein n=1 Tax=Legionella sp. PC997 TaxID=2755562 RepID=UPI0015FD6581|nr:hypothetical protein [Legionella sp. PC997]QMT61573.1 hypothetical protein HBNCFIEN_02977 [Legionella sp. PC997]
MLQKTEIERVDKVKFSPAQNSGDCGYHVVVIGIFYLALKAAVDESIRSALNSSKLLTKILEAQPNSLKGCLVKSFKTNHECLLSYLDAMAAHGFEQLSFNEILSNFTLQLKQANTNSPWLHERLKNEIKSGLWLEDNRVWEKLASFKSIMKKIEAKSDELYEKATREKSLKSDNDSLYAIIFQAQIEVCNALADEELSAAAQEVITHFYTGDAPKVWVDSEFLKTLVGDLLGTSSFMFDKDGAHITSNGPSESHWYVNLPNDEYTKQFMSIYKSGYHSGLTIVLPGTKLEVSLSSYSSLFSPATNININNDFEGSIFFPYQ